MFGWIISFLFIKLYATVPITAFFTKKMAGFELEVFNLSPENKM